MRAKKAPLPTRQERLLRAIRTFWSTQGFGPTVRELTILCEISSTAVTHYNLGCLVERGLVLRNPRTARSIRLATSAGQKLAPKGK